jgi:hypothetical protein
MPYLSTLHNSALLMLCERSKSYIAQERIGLSHLDTLDFAGLFDPPGERLWTGFVCRKQVASLIASFVRLVLFVGVI